MTDIDRLNTLKKDIKKLVDESWEQMSRFSKDHQSEADDKLYWIHKEYNRKLQEIYHNIPDPAFFI